MSPSDPPVAAPTPHPEDEYRRRLVEHNTAVQAALTATTEAVREYLMKRFRLDLYSIEWVTDQIAALERLSRVAAPTPETPSKGENR